MLTVLLGAIVTHGQADAQALDDRAAGATYILAFPDTTTNTYDTRFANRRLPADTIALFIYSGVDNQVTISSPSGYQNKILPRAGKFEIVYLNSAQNKAANSIMATSNKVVNHTFRIEAQYPVVVYCYYVTKFGGEAFTPIPVENWGLEYYVAAHPGEVPQDVSPGGETDYRSKNKKGPAEFVVVAAFDNTTVTITPGPRAQFLDFPPMSVKLDANQAFQWQSQVDTLSANIGGDQPDISGSYITADKPIGVVSGLSRGQLNPYEQAGLAKNSFKNMYIEWLAPVETHGKYFVYLPTWDDRRIKGEPGEKISEKRPAELVRVYGEVNGYTTQGQVIEASQTTDFTLANQAVREFRFGDPVPRAIITDTSSQAFMSSMATTIFKGTTGSTGFLGAAYEGYGGYMVEMVPREQWPSFAPYWFPQYPGQMEHFLNVVTDTANRLNVFDETNQRITFNLGSIAGTDLVWGSVRGAQGVTHWLEGRNGAKFYAFAYGLYKGYELYRPGKTKKKDDGGSALAGGGRGKGDRLLHPSEYEEDVAVAYGYPLAPARLVLRPGDSLLIDSTMDCFTLSIRARAINDRPVGLKSVSLDPTTVNNAKLIFVEPEFATEVIGRTEIRVKVEPIDRLKNASAVVIITDRTGKRWRITYTYEAERVDMLPRAVADFGYVTQGECKDTVVKITNPLNKPVTIKKLRMYFGSIQGFTITSPDTAAMPLTLESGQTIDVNVRFCPNVEPNYADTLIATLGCTEVKLPVRGTSAKPCIYVGNLNFGNFTLGTTGPKTMDLELCNTAEAGLVRFTNPNTGGAVLEWLDQNFSVDPAEITRLESTVLGPGECVTIKVTFTPTQVGPFKTTAKFWTTTDCTRDTSVWTATVTQPGPQLTPYDWKERWLIAGASCKNPIDGYPIDIFAFNNGSEPITVDTLFLRGDDADAGIFVLDRTNDLWDIRRGERLAPPVGTDTPKIAQRVIFRPQGEQNYSATAVLVTTTGDTVTSQLLGIGIESHVAATDVDFGRQFYRGGLQIPGVAVVRSPRFGYPSRPLTVTDIVLADPANYMFQDKAALGLPRVLQPGDTMQVPLYFTPQQPGDMTAELLVIGDHSCLDDSTSTLIGTTYTLGAATRDENFGDPLTCDVTTRTIPVINTGSDTVSLTGYSLADASGWFTVTNAPTLPMFIAPGDSVLYTVEFAPTSSSNGITSTLNFEIQNAAQDSVIANLVSTLTGRAHMLTVNVDVADDFAAYPGTKLSIPMVLQQPLDEAQVREIYITMSHYQKGMMTLQNFQNMLNGTLLQGWTVDATASTSRPGYFTLKVTAPAGDYLKGTGPLLNMEYLTYIGSSDTSHIVYTVEALDRSACVDIVESEGLARIDSVCGLNFRLIEIASGSYTLDQNKPNPFNPTTVIPFEVAIDGPTTLRLYDAYGNVVAKLVDGDLKAGKYEVTWDATGYPSGMYYYRLESRHWSRTNTMILKK